MVFKLTEKAGNNHESFENDVKEYGFQTTAPVIVPVAVFENDVKEYGFQTHGMYRMNRTWFENDVKEYGFQTTFQG